MPAEAGRRAGGRHTTRNRAATAAAGAFAAVFYGHSHRRDGQAGSCLGLNPGEVMGRLGRSSYGWYDTASGEGGIHDLRD